MDSMTIMPTPRLASANQGPASGERLLKIDAIESSASQRQDGDRKIPVELFTGVIAIPLALSISIVMSVKVGLATLAFAYLIGWAVSRSKRNG